MIGLISAAFGRPDLLPLAEEKDDWFDFGRLRAAEPVHHTHLGDVRGRYFATIESSTYVQAYYALAAAGKKCGSREEMRQPGKDAQPPGVLADTSRREESRRWVETGSGY